MAVTTPDGDEGRSLHDIAVDITTDLHKLATGLGSAGASPHAVQELAQMAQMTGDIAKALAANAAGPGAAQPGQMPPPGPPQQAGPPAPAGPPPGVPQAPQAPPPGTPQHDAHQTLHAATHALHAAMIASKQGAQQLKQ